MKKHRITYIVYTIILLLIGAAFLTGFVLTLSATFCIAGAILTLWGIIRLIRISRNKLPKSVPGNTVGAVILTLIVSWWIGLVASPISGGFSWQYKFQRAYTSIFHTLREENDFPAEIPQGATGYFYDFFPSVLQGTGHTAVSFYAPDDYIESVREKVESASIRTVNLGETGSYDSKEAFYISSTDREEHKNGTVYILYTNNYWTEPVSRPHASVVLIDGNYICYSDM